jgi:hypothetical protein
MPGGFGNVVGCMVGSVNGCLAGMVSVFVGGDEVGRENRVFCLRIDNGGVSGGLMFGHALGLIRWLSKRTEWRGDGCCEKWGLDGIVRGGCGWKVGIGMFGAGGNLWITLVPDMLQLYAVRKKASSCGSIPQSRGSLW